jgi:hypothetical protein
MRKVEKNGVEDAAVAAILQGGQDNINNYLVRSAFKTQKVMEDLPDMIVTASADAIKECRLSNTNCANHVSQLWSERNARQGNERLDVLWSERTEREGMYTFWSTVGKVSIPIIAALSLILAWFHG